MMHTPFTRRSIVLLLLFCSCASVGKLKTHSGRPEVTIAGASLKTLKDLCAAPMMAEGYTVHTNSGYSLIMLMRETPSLFQAAGNIHEAVFNFAEFGNKITIYHLERTTEYVSTKYERVLDNNDQEQLESQQKRLEVIAAEAKRLQGDDTPLQPRTKL
jgi:hypothetical protein